MSISIGSSESSSTHVVETRAIGVGAIGVDQGLSLTLVEIRPFGRDRENRSRFQDHAMAPFFQRGIAQSFDLRRMLGIDEIQDGRGRQHRDQIHVVEAFDTIDRVKSPIQREKSLPPTCHRCLEGFTDIGEFFLIAQVAIQALVFIDREILAQTRVQELVGLSLSNHIARMGFAYLREGWLGKFHVMYEERILGLELFLEDHPIQTL